MGTGVLRMSIIALACSFAYQTSVAEIIRIRVLNGHNGKPIANEQVSLYIKGEKDALSYTTDMNGTFTLDLDPSKEVLPSTEWWITCRKINPTAPHLFSVEAIHNDGATDENTCGKAKSEVIRGTLTIFARKASFFENMAR